MAAMKGHVDLVEYLVQTVGIDAEVTIHMYTLASPTSFHMTACADHDAHLQ